MYSTLSLDRHFVTRQSTGTVESDMCRALCSTYQCAFHWLTPTDSLPLTHSHWLTHWHIMGLNVFCALHCTSLVDVNLVPLLTRKLFITLLHEFDIYIFFLRSSFLAGCVPGIRSCTMIVYSLSFFARETKTPCCLEWKVVVIQNSVMHCKLSKSEHFLKIV